MHLTNSRMPTPTKQAGRPVACRWVAGAAATGARSIGGWGGGLAQLAAAARTIADLSDDAELPAVPNMVRQYYRPEMDHHVSDRALWTMMNEQMYGAFGANTPDWKTYCLRDLRERFGPGFPRDARTAAGVSPLYDAMHFGCLRFAELLMELGGDLEMRTHAGKSLLMACIDGNKPEAARWLLAQWRRRAGKPLEVLLEGRSAVGYTPLWCVYILW